MVCEREVREARIRPPSVPPGFWDTDQMRDALAARHLGRVIRAYRMHPHHGARPLSQELVASWAGLTQAQLSRMESGPVIRDLDRLTKWARLLGIPQRVLWFDLPETSRAARREGYDAQTDAELGLNGVRRMRESAAGSVPTAGAAISGSPTADAPDDEYEALELARRVAASDVGEETIRRLEAVADDLAVAYPVSPPRVLLDRIRLHLGYVSKLLDGRKTLDEHRRLMVVGGWLSLLGATVHIDLKQDGAATARLKTASQLAVQAEHDEIRAWCLETSAWRVLTNGDYARAVQLAQAAQALAPASSSAEVQATAQEGRAWARLGQAPETYDAMKRVNTLVAARAKPERPGHHYHYDPEKVTAYSATTLAWLGDPAAEAFARELIVKLEGRDDLSGKWPRRLASANLDLALTLIVTDRLDEACAKTLDALSSGYVALSNRWRALEVVSAVEARGLREAAELREAYEALR